MYVTVGCYFMCYVIIRCTDPRLRPRRLLAGALPWVLPVPCGAALPFQSEDHSHRIRSLSSSYTGRDCKSDTERGEIRLWVCWEDVLKVRLLLGSITLELSLSLSESANFSFRVPYLNNKKRDHFISVYLSVCLSRPFFSTMAKGINLKYMSNIKAVKKSSF